MRKYNDRVDDEIWKADKLFNRCFHCHLAVIESKKSYLTKKCFSKLKNDAHTSFYTNFKKRAENGPFGPGRAYLLTGRGRAGPICSRAGPGRAKRKKWRAGPGRLFFGPCHALIGTAGFPALLLYP